MSSEIDSKQELERHIKDVTEEASRAREALEALEKHRQEQEARRKRTRGCAIALGLVLAAAVLFAIVSFMAHASYERLHCVAPSELPTEWYNGAYYHRVSSEYSLTVPGQVRGRLASPSSPLELLLCDRIAFEATRFDRIIVDIEPEEWSETSPEGFTDLYQYSLYLVAPNGTTAVAESQWREADTADIPETTLLCSGTYFVYVEVWGDQPENAPYQVTVRRR